MLIEVLREHDPPWLAASQYWGSAHWELEVVVVAGNHGCHVDAAQVDSYVRLRALEPDNVLKEEVAGPNGFRRTSLAAAAATSGSSSGAWSSTSAPTSSATRMASSATSFG